MGSVCEGRRMGQPIFSLYHQLWINTLSLPEKFKHWLNLDHQPNYCRTQVQDHLFLFIYYGHHEGRLILQNRLSKILYPSCLY